MNEIQKYISEICDLDIEKAIFSNKAQKDGKYNKTVIRKLSDGKYQSESFTDKQAFHENISADNLYEKMTSVFPELFIQAEIFTDAYIYSAKVTKKGEAVKLKTQK